MLSNICCWRHAMGKLLVAELCPDCLLSAVQGWTTTHKPLCGTWECVSLTPSGPVHMLASQPSHSHNAATQLQLCCLCFSKHCAVWAAIRGCGRLESQQQVCCWACRPPIQHYYTHGLTRAMWYCTAPWLQPQTVSSNQPTDKWVGVVGGVQHGVGTGVLSTVCSQPTSQLHCCQSWRLWVHCRRCASSSSVCWVSSHAWV